MRSGNPCRCPATKKGRCRLPHPENVKALAGEPLALAPGSRQARTGLARIATRIRLFLASRGARLLPRAGCCRMRQIMGRRSRDFHWAGRLLCRFLLWPLARRWRPSFRCQPCHNTRRRRHPPQLLSRRLRRRDPPRCLHRMRSRTRPFARSRPIPKEPSARAAYCRCGG